MSVLYSIICVELLQQFSGILFCHLVSSNLSKVIAWNSCNSWIVMCPYYAVQNSYSGDKIGTNTTPCLTYRGYLAFSKIIRGYISWIRKNEGEVTMAYFKILSFTFLWYDGRETRKMENMMVSWLRFPLDVFQYLLAPCKPIQQCKQVAHYVTTNATFYYYNPRWWHSPWLYL
jgi:hypothetical protein